MKKSIVAILGLAFTSATVYAQDEYERVGVTDTEVIIGAHTAESGRNADNAPTPQAIAAYFDDVNKAGGVHGRKIKWLRIDAQSIQAKVVDATRKLVEEDKVFALVGAMGQAHSAVRQYLQDRRIPDLFFTDGNSAYVEPWEPSKRIFFPMQLPFVKDGEIGGAYMAKKMPGKKFCFLVTTNETGALYEKGVRNAVNAFNTKQTDSSKKITWGPSERVDRQDPNANVGVLKLMRAKCDMVATTLSGSLFARAVNYGFDQGFKPMWLGLQTLVFHELISLIKEGARANIISTTVLLKDAPLDTSPGQAKWKKHVEFFKRHNIKDPSKGSNAIFRAEVFVEVLKRAGRDLTRTKLIEAAESLKGYQCDVCLTPLEYSKDNHWPFLNAKMVTIKNGYWHYAE